jgi:phage shock protein C
VAGATAQQGTAGATGVAGAARYPGAEHTGRATGYAAAAGTPNAAGATATFSAPGCAYTACNPQAYDAAGPQEQTAGAKPYRFHTGIMLGILLVGIGVLALLGTFFNLAAWNFWPLIIIAFGFMFLCTPSRSGWSLARAGHALSLLAIGFTLLLWTLGIIGIRAFVLTFLYLWPVLLVMLGLFIIGNATGKSVFRLFGSLLFSLALLFGIWNFGQAGAPLYIDLPGGQSIQVPALPPSFVPSENDAVIQNNTWLSN